MKCIQSASLERAGPARVASCLRSGRTTGSITDFVGNAEDPKVRTVGRFCGPLFFAQKMKYQMGSLCRISALAQIQYRFRKNEALYVVRLFLPAASSILLKRNPTRLFLSLFILD